MSKTQDAHSVPRDESGRYALVFDQPGFWEYALYASVMLDQLAAYEPVWRDHEIGYVAAIGPQIALADLPNFLIDRAAFMLKLVDNLNRLLAPETQSRAFGDPGESGDPLLIEHSARRLVDMYANMIDWAAQLRAIRVDPKAERSVEVLAQFAEQPIRSLRSFVSDYAAQVDDVLKKSRSGELQPKFEINMLITFEIPRGKSTEFERELARLLE